MNGNEHDISIQTLPLMGELEGAVGLGTSFLGRGWSFPPVLTAHGVQMSSYEQDIRESLRVLFSTSPGERVNRYDYGCSLRRYAFEPLTVQTTVRLRNDISRAVTLYEPRIELEDVSFEEQPEKGLLLIHLTYTVVRTNNRNNMVYPFSIVQGGEPQEVRVSIDTRATTDGDTWTWENNDVIGLNVTGYNGTSSSYTLTYNAQTGSWTRSGTIIVTLPGTITAWYPGETGTSATSFTIPVNQTTNVNLCKADFMTYSGDLISTTPSVTLEHRLSKVIVTIADWSDYGSAMPTVTDFKIQTLESITVSNNTVTGGGNTIGVAPYNNGNTYTAIVAPGAGFTITLTVDRRRKTVTYSGTLESGNAYSFNLTLKDNELVLTPIGSLPGWPDLEQTI